MIAQEPAVGPSLRNEGHSYLRELRWLCLGDYNLHRCAALPGVTPSRQGPSGSPKNCTHAGMPLYYFKQVDTRIVPNHGVHNLPDEAAARLEAIKASALFARNSPEVDRAALLYLTDEHGAGICVVPVDDI